MKMVNIGCGACYHPAWINLDLASTSPDVIAHDASRGLPFPSDAVDVCYSSHVLEHLRASEADAFLKEQFRVLKPGGLIRVVVPDLERICRLYLEHLEALTAGDAAHEFPYDYSLLELYDQTTRDSGGGDLRETWLTAAGPDRDYALSRHGREAENVIRQLQGEPTVKAQNGSRAGKKSLSRRTIRRALEKGRLALANAAVRVLAGGRGLRAFREGVFRNSGEIHRVMYDRYRLARLLRSHCFGDVAVCAADESRIPGFNDFQLDVVEGSTRKPDSLFIEAVKIE